MSLFSCLFYYFQPSQHCQILGLVGLTVPRLAKKHAQENVAFTIVIYRLPRQEHVMIFVSVVSILYDNKMVTACYT